MATGDKLVNLDELKLVYDKLHVPSVQVQIPTGQWSGSSTRTYTVNATNVTADTIIDWAMDSSINYLKADLTVTPGSGTIQFSTTAIPAGTINVTLFFPGVNGEVVIQTLADVYSKSQVDQKISQSTANTPQAIVINDGQTTWSAIYAKLKEGLNNAGNGKAIALITVYSTAATSILSGGNVSSYFKGYVTLSGSNNNLYDFFGGSLSSGHMHAWRVTASDSGPTISNFREFRDSSNCAKSAYTNWGTTITANGFHHGMFYSATNTAYLIWFSSTANISIRSLRSGTYTKESTNGTVQFSYDGDGTNFTITRSGSTITITSSSTTTMSLIYT